MVPFGRRSRSTQRHNRSKGASVRAERAWCSQGLNLDTFCPLLRLVVVVIPGVDPSLLYEHRVVLVIGAAQRLDLREMQH
jgi:hypothetical protein